jgi:hypothetical protein
VNLQDGKETTIQISTPKGKKCRRISVNTGSKMERFSLIPKLDRSFSYCESDEDFEVHILKNIIIHVLLIKYVVNSGICM